ncbi:MAG TPA: peptide ABC transporter substrate-binding protein [Stellaceae bacterium]|nr:peptide ABC transporter substrate-binding protein [Stellaceae bacterium]
MKPILAWAALLLLAAGSARAGQVLHRPNEAEPGSLDPQRMTAGPTVATSRDLFEGLIALDHAGKPVPGDAESWDISPDGLTWTFHLRHGLQWSNGDPLTSADYLYSFRRLVDPATAADDPSDLKQVVNYEAIISGKEKDLTKLGVEAPDPYTLRLHLIEPRLALKFLLTDPQVYPLHRATIEKWGKDWTQPGHMVSNGPYVLTSWIPQTDIIVKKNERFYDASSVAIDEVHWIGAEDMDAALRRFRAGELDWMDCLKTNVAICKSDLADQFHTAPINSVGLLVINMTKGPLSKDIRLREALNLSVDRVTLLDKVVRLNQLPAYSLVPPVISDYTPPTMSFKDMPMAERIAKARQLMEAAGYGPANPLKITVSYPSRESTRQSLLAIIAMWHQIYVDAAMDNMEFQVYESRLNSKDYEIGMMAALGSYDDFENVLDNYRSDAGAFNWTGYNNPKFDDLFHRGGTSLDMSERRKLMEEAEAVVLNDYITVPLDFDVRNRVVSPKLQNFDMGVLYPQSRYLSFAE